MHPAGAARRGGELTTTCSSCCSPTCARPTCAAATCARRSPPTGSRERRLGELVERRGRDVVEAGVRRGARLRRAAHARGARASSPDGALRGRAARSRATASPTRTSRSRCAVTIDGDDAADRLRGHRRPGRGQRQLPARGHALGAATSRCACCCRDDVPANAGTYAALEHRGARGLASSTRGRRPRSWPATWRPRSAIADTVLPRSPQAVDAARPGPGHDEQPRHRRPRAGPTTRRSAAARARARAAPGRRACTSG